MKNKIFNKIFSLLFVAAAILYTACEEVIDVELSGTESKIVIEGKITDEPGPYYVFISKTTDYFVPGDYPQIKGAVVTITDDLGIVDHLKEFQPGVYQTNLIKGTPGRKYFLTVSVDGVNYTARSSMPLPTEIDSVYSEKKETGLRDKSEVEYGIVCNFKDRVNYTNYCRINVKAKNKQEENFYLYNDRLSDGNYINYKRIFSRFNMNDTVKVDLLSIDEPVYQYYFTLSNAIASDGNGNPIMSTSTPANPISNISGNALGYFSACTVRSKTLVIK